MFRVKKSIPLPYEVQGYIYFFSLRYHHMTRRQKDMVEAVCREAGGKYSEALKEFVTTDVGAVRICGKYYVSESTLERAVVKYYCLLAKKI